MQWPSNKIVTLVKCNFTERMWTLAIFSSLKDCNSNNELQNKHICTNLKAFSNSIHIFLCHIKRPTPQQFLWLLTPTVGLGKVSTVTYCLKYPSTYASHLLSLENYKLYQNGVTETLRLILWNPAPSLQTAQPSSRNCKCTDKETIPYRLVTQECCQLCPMGYQAKPATPLLRTKPESLKQYHSPCANQASTFRFHLILRLLYFLCHCDGVNTKQLQSNDVRKSS